MQHSVSQAGGHAAQTSEGGDTRTLTAHRRPAALQIGDAWEYCTWHRSWAGSSLRAQPFRGCRLPGTVLLLHCVCGALASAENILKLESVSLPSKVALTNTLHSRTAAPQIHGKTVSMQSTNAWQTRQGSVLLGSSLQKRTGRYGKRVLLTGGSSQDEVYNVNASPTLTGSHVLDTRLEASQSIKLKNVLADNVPLHETTLGLQFGQENGKWGPPWRRKRAGEGEQGNVPVALILGISIPAVVMVLGLIALFVMYRHKKIQQGKQAEREENERAAEQAQVKMKQESGVSAEMVFGGDVGDPPTGPGDPGTSISKTFQRQTSIANDQSNGKDKTNGIQGGMELGLGPLFADTTQGPGTLMQSGEAQVTVPVQANGDGHGSAPVIRDLFRPTGQLLNLNGEQATAAEADRGAAPVLPARGITPRGAPAMSEGGFGTADLSGADVKGEQQQQQQGNDEAAINAASHGSYSNAKPMAAAANGRIPSSSSARGSMVPRVLSHTVVTPVSSRQPSVTRDEVDDEVNGLAKLAVTDASLRKADRRPYLPQRTAPSDAAVIEQNILNMQQHMRQGRIDVKGVSGGGGGDGIPLSGTRARELPPTPDPASPKFNSQSARGPEGAGNGATNGGEWRSSVSDLLERNGYNVAGQVSNPLGRMDLASAQARARPLPPPSNAPTPSLGPHAMGRQGEGGVITLDPDTMLPVIGGEVTPPKRARAGGGASRSSRTPNRAGNGTYSIARQSRYGRQDTSFNSAMDDSDSDGGDATRHGPRSGRSSPSYSDTSRRSEESIRSYDGWRNGFRTRANSQLPSRSDPGRRRIMDLHREMFHHDRNGSPGPNMATPVELPGDKGVSFYQGRSSLHGRMHVQSIENAANNFKERAPPTVGVIRDEDEVWG